DLHAHALQARVDGQQAELFELRAEQPTDAHGDASAQRQLLYAGVAVARAIGRQRVGEPHELPGPGSAVALQEAMDLEVLRIVEQQAPRRAPIPAGASGFL